MRYCVYGLGAIGGCLAARLATSGEDVCGVARGATLAAVRDRGLELRDATGTVHATLPVAEHLADLGPVDCLILAVKATALPSALDDLRSLPAETTVLTAMNGVSWWFTRGLGGPLEGSTLHTVDPDGALAAAIPAHRVIGSAVHLTCAVPAPGMITMSAGNELVIGAAAPGTSLEEATETVGKDLTAAGFDIRVSPNVRQDVWYKLWGNLSFNPVSLITRATADQILADPLAREFVGRCMTEAGDIGAHLGFRITDSVQDRLQIAVELGAFKTSMLQDAEAGRPVELDALLGSVQEIGALLGTPTPHIDALLGLSRVHARVHGLDGTARPRGAA